MCGIVALLVLLSGVFGFAAFGSQTASAPVEVTTEVQAVPTQAIACATAPADQDVPAMLALVGDTFKSSEWTQQVGGDGSRTTLTWRSATSTAYLEYLHFDCGYSQSQLDQYFSPEGLRTMFSYYDSYQETYQCKSGDLRLHEFDLVYHGSDYHALYWVKKVSPTRIADLVLVFPTSEADQEAEYAGMLFPELPTCQAPAG